METEGPSTTVLIDFEDYAWYLYRGPGKTLWLSVIRTSRVVSSAMYELVVKIDPDDEAWTESPNREFIGKIRGRALSDEDRYAGGADPQEFRALHVDNSLAKRRG